MPRAGGASSNPRAIGRTDIVPKSKFPWLLDRPVKPGDDNLGIGRKGVAAPFDLAIIGGGINGCGIARDAAGRGLSVYLCEMGDLASGTSSRSTKLIHGGLRYLEQYDFRLVREALAEREVLWRIAPHIVRPLRFVLPHQAGLRPAWMLRIGPFPSHHASGRRRLPGPSGLPPPPA